LRNANALNAMQESPGSVLAGRLPRSKNVILLHDLVDIARPGEEIDITGIYLHGYDSGLNAQTGFPVFATYLEANNVKRRADDFSLANITEEVHEQIQMLGRDKRAGQRIMNSIAPSIFGHEHIKAAIAMALFGGQEKQVGSHRLRYASAASL
jgi:DNA replication licensing factor MCM2